MDKIKFYDTNELLHNLEEIEGKIYLSSITLQELEHIKTSKNKDENVRFEARRVTRFLRDNPDRYECIVVGKHHYEILEEMNLPIDNDNLIIACAYYSKINKDGECDREIEFYTDDICCYNIAKNIFGLNCKSIKRDKAPINYKGFKEIIMTDEELATFYEIEVKENIYDLLDNEYLILKNTLNQPIDAWYFNGAYLDHVETKNVKSLVLGKMKVNDFYQLCALHSLENNKLTLIKGKAGSGKSFLAMNYMISQLEKGKIDKIIMFINDTCVRGAEEHGFLPGTIEEKLLSGNIGAFLMGKLGDKTQAYNYMNTGKLVLMPVSDIRGFDTNGMNATIYCTEAQNLSVDMLKLMIQRIGEDCNMILDGDYDTQLDNKLFEGSNNGLRRMSEVFRGRDLYGEVELQSVYRSELAKIADKM